MDFKVDEGPAKLTLRVHRSVDERRGTGRSVRQIPLMLRVRRSIIKRPQCLPGTEDWPSPGLVLR